VHHPTAGKGKGGMANMGGMGMSPMNGGKGDGKSKGKGVMGMSMAGMGMGGMGGMDYGKGGKGKGQDGYGAATQSNIDMLSNAVSQLPPSLASDRSQALQFNCQAEFVSALIGKAGQGTKQIAIMTDTKIMIREIEGNTTEKAVVVKGNAINVASVPWIEDSGRFCRFSRMPVRANYPEADIISEI